MDNAYGQVHVYCWQWRLYMCSPHQQSPWRVQSVSTAHYTGGGCQTIKHRPIRCVVILWQWPKTLTIYQSLNANPQAIRRVGLPFQKGKHSDCIPVDQNIPLLTFLASILSLFLCLLLNWEEWKLNLSQEWLTDKVQYRSHSFKVTIT